MNYNLLTIYIFIFLILTTRQFHLSYYTELESKLRQLTMETLTKISSNLYMINYLNDYYLQDLLQFNNKEIADIVKFAYQKFGTEYDFNIQAFTPGFACSSFNVFNRENHNLFGRNFDYDFSPSFILWTQPKKGYKSISFIHGGFIGIYDETNLIKDRLLLAPYAPMDGMNEYGVAVSVLLIENNSTHQINPDLVDITTTIIIRGILDTCINVEKAIKFFNKFNYHDAIEGTNCHFMVTDAKGNSAVIEYINNEMKIIQPIGNYSFVTNFYLYFDRISEIKGGLDYRYDILKENLNDSNVKMEWNEAVELLNKVRQEITLWSNIYDTRNSTVITAFRSDYSILYEFNLFNPLKNIIKTLPGPEPEITSDMESSSEEEYNSEIESEKTTTSETESFASHLKLSLSFLISISLLF